MAGKISEQTDRGPADGAELIEVSIGDGGGGFLTRKMTAQEVANLSPTSGTYEGLSDTNVGTKTDGHVPRWSSGALVSAAFSVALDPGFPNYALSGNAGMVVGVQAGGGGLDLYPIVSDDADNALSAGSDGGAFLNTSALGGGGGGVLDMAFWKSGTLAASEVLFLAGVTRAATIADDLAGSQVYVGTNPTATAVLSVRKNGSEFGTISISTGGAPTLATSAAAETLSAGDRIEIVGPASADASLADVSVTLKVDAS